MELDSFILFSRLLFNFQFSAIGEKARGLYDSVAAAAVLVMVVVVAGEEVEVTVFPWLKIYSNWLWSW